MFESGCIEFLWPKTGIFAILGPSLSQRLFGQMNDRLWIQIRGISDPIVCCDTK